MAASTSYPGLGTTLVSAFDEAGFEKRLRRLQRTDPQWKQFVDEEKLHEGEWSRLEEEVKELDNKENETEESKKDIELKLNLKKLEHNLAWSQRNKAHYQQRQRESELEKDLLTNVLKTATNVDMKIKIQRRLERAEGRIRERKETVKRYECEVHECKGELGSLQKEAEQAERSKQLLDEAMKEGYVGVLILVCIVLGQPGVGKTSLKHLLLDLRPPELRSSTICAETPVRIELRPVTEARFQSLGKGWKEVKDEGIVETVARMILWAEKDGSIFCVESKAANAGKKEDKGFFTRIVNFIKGRSKVESSTKTLDTGSGRGLTLSQPAMSPTSEACQVAMKKIMCELVQCITKVKNQEGQPIFLDNPDGQLLRSMWVYFSDCGGQPEYHELLPLFVRRISSALCVTRLTDKLDEIQPAEYFDEGEMIGLPRQSQLSAKDTIKCLVTTTQSYSSQEYPPTIIMVGTHLDKLEEKTKQLSATEASSEPQAKGETALLPNPPTAAGEQPTLSSPAVATPHSDQHKAEGSLQERETNDVPISEATFSEAAAQVAVQPLPREMQTSQPLPGSVASTEVVAKKPLKENQPSPTAELSDEAAAMPPPSVQPVAAERVETLEEKNRLLLEMLEPEFSNQLVYASQEEPKQLIFSLNARNPGDKERVLAQNIREAVEKSGAREEKIPIWWHVMERLLHQLAKELGRGVLSRAECLEMAHLLDIREESFEAALVYFDELNIIKYNPHVLREVIFVNSQIPLDKVSEYVYHNYRMRLPGKAAAEMMSSAKRRVWNLFCDHGVVSEEVMDHFPRHYVSDIFTKDHLIKFLTNLLVFAEIPPPDKRSSSSQKYFIMPALLRILSEVELEKHRVPFPIAATLLVRFPSRSRHAGVFCCFLVHLIRYYGWKLLLESKEPLYRNCAKLHLPTSPPATVTLIDSNTYIEVHANITASAPRNEYTSTVRVIRQATLNGIRAACVALKFKETNPEFAFHCPHTSPPSEKLAQPVKRHTATLTKDKKYWWCDLVPQISNQLNDRQSIWFGVREVATGDDNSSGLSPMASSNQLPQASTSLDCSSNNTPTASIPLTTGSHFPQAATGVDNHSAITPTASQPSTLGPLQASASASVAVSQSTTSPVPQGAVEFRHLALIRWKDDNGRSQKLFLMENISYKWRTIGQLIGLPYSKLEGLAEQHLKNPEHCCRSVLGQWLENPPQDYPATWAGLIEVLEDSQLGEVVSQLRTALSKANL